MTRRRRNSNAAIISAALVLAVLAAYGAYLVAAGLVVALGAAGVWVVKRAQAHSARAPIVTYPKRRPPQPATPDRHVALLDVPRVVFDDLLTTEAEAIKVFTAWIRQHPGAPAEPSALVHASKVQTRFVGRLKTTFERRDFQWQERPHTGLSEPTKRPSVTAAMLWELSDHDLARATEHAAECDDCRGAGQVSCSICKGTAAVACPACHGERKRYDIARNGSKRLMNCTVCSAKGGLSCTACAAGRISCHRCEGHGRLSRWAVKISSRREDVQIEPDDGVTKAFSWGSDGVAASRSDIEADARVVEQLDGTPTIDPAVIRTALGQPWFENHWTAIQPKPAAGERAVQQTLLHLEIPAVEVSWTLNGGTPRTSRFEGFRLLAPPMSTEPLFERRTRIRSGVGVMMGLMPLAAALTYAVRGAYFLKPEAVFVVCLVGLMASLLFVAFGRSFDGLARAPLVTSMAAIVGVGAAGVAYRLEPTPADVELALVAHDVPTAEAALAALLWSNSEHDVLQRRITLEKVLLLKTSDDVLSGITLLLPTPSEQRTTAIAHLDALLLADAKSAVGSSEPHRALAVLQRITVPSAERDVVASSAHRSLVNMCLARNDYRCARDRAQDAVDPILEKDVAQKMATELQQARAGLAQAGASARPDARLAAVARLQSALSLVEPTPSTVEELRRLSDRSQRLTHDIAAQDARERVRQERKNADARAQVQRRENDEWARETRERARNRGVRCCDGTYSPTCSTAHRGCCSVHGGICG